MSHGHGSMERYVLASLANHGAGLSSAQLAALHPDAKGAVPSRSLRHSLGRALRQLLVQQQIGRLADRSIFRLHERAVISHSKLRVAYHEAGHAVIARILSVPVEYVTIRRRRKTGGWAVIGKSNRSLRDNIIINFAGTLAEKECLKLATRLTVDAKDKETIKDAIRLLDIFPEDVAGDWTTLKKETRALVRKHKAAIERVAQALMEHQTLSGEQLDRIISGG